MNMPIQTLDEQAIQKAMDINFQIYEQIVAQNFTRDQLIGFMNAMIYQQVALEDVPEFLKQLKQNFREAEIKNND